MFQGSAFRPGATEGFMPQAHLAGSQMVAPAYSPPKLQGSWAPPRVAYGPPDLAPRHTMGQLEKLLGAGMVVNVLETGIGAAVSYLGFYNGVNSKGPLKWLGWLVGVAGSAYTLSALSSLFKIGERKEVVEKVSQ